MSESCLPEEESPARWFRLLHFLCDDLKKKILRRSCRRDLEGKDGSVRAEKK